MAAHIYELLRASCLLSCYFGDFIKKRGTLLIPTKIYVPKDNAAKIQKKYKISSQNPVFLNCFLCDSKFEIVLS